MSEGEQYNAEDDFARSIDECYRVIRERKAQGGPGWEPKDPVRSALEATARERELNAKALVDSALLVRDLQCSMRQAIEAIDRKSYATARMLLKQGLDEIPQPQRRRERE